ncbi:MAG: transcription antitermination factor NusB [bacterium]|nr:transcription antitermination factor NusB [bacterium]
MSRRELREHLFRMLFRKEFHNQTELNEQIDMYFNTLEQPKESDLEYLRAKFAKIIEKIDEIDASIEAASAGWKLSRLGKVDLTILRLAVYEIVDDEDIPTGVAINEAVELAKKFGEDQSPSFINGILAKVANK